MTAGVSSKSASASSERLKPRICCWPPSPARRLNWSRYFTVMRVESVLELLLADEANPRAIGFQLATLVDHLRHLPGYDSLTEKPPPLALAEAVLEAVRLGSETPLAELMTKVKASLYDISDALAARHFSHLTVPRLAF